MRDQASCACFVQRDTSCYLGHPSKNETLLGSPQNEAATLHIGQGFVCWMNYHRFQKKSPEKHITDYLDSVTSSFVLEHVTSSHWHDCIYKSVPIDSNNKRSQRASELCSILDPVEITKCDMVLMDNSFCHLNGFRFTGSKSNSAYPIHTFYLFKK